MQEEHTRQAPPPKAPEEHITLSQAAAKTPGRPDISCLWRWCRRGVMARNGQRIRLRHQRVGGKLFTTQVWLDEFFRALAAADTAYFDAKDAAAAATPPRDAAFGPPRSKARIDGARTAQADDDAKRRREDQELDRELDAEGL